MADRAYPRNPLLPRDAFVPDAEARMWADGRMYLYGSWDIGGKDEYCSALYHVYSSPDLVNWKDHGVSFRSSGPESAVGWSSANLYAPDAAYKNGRYYLYFCLSDGTEGVAESDSPAGPFINAARVEGMDGIDPGVFVDDDGQAYIYWGQFDGVRAARLNPDMRSIDAGSVVQPLSVAEHNFHEGSSMRKRNGVYYYVYADTGRHGGRPTCLGYATSSSPLGPFTYRGVIVDNFGCDPAVWNNHGSISEFNGRWYVFYHRSSRGTIFNRRVCAEPLSFREDGSIPEAEMTSQGVGGPIDARSGIDAGAACLLSGSVRIDACPYGGEMLAQAGPGDWAAFKYVDFGAGVGAFCAAASSPAGGCVEIRLDAPDGPLAGVCDVPPGEGPGGEARCAVAGASGVHALYLRFAGREGAALQLSRFRFE